MTPSSPEILDRVIALLTHARDAAVDAHEDEPEVGDAILDEVTRTVLDALAGTWVAEILPHCPTCAAPDDQDADACACGHQYRPDVQSESGLDREPEVTS